MECLGCMCAVGKGLKRKVVKLLLEAVFENNI